MRSFMDFIDFFCILDAVLFVMWIFEKQIQFVAVWIFEKVIKIMEFFCERRN